MNQKNPSFDLKKFEFIEMSTQNPKNLDHYLQQMGFVLTGSDKSNQVDLYEQDNCKVIVNLDPQSHAYQLATKRAPYLITSMGWSVEGLDQAILSLKAKDAPFYNGSQNILPLPCIEGLGDTLIYLLDANNTDQFFKTYFSLYKATPPAPSPFSLTEIDHLTGHVLQGDLEKWHHFYQHFFGFKVKKDFGVHFNKTHYRFSALISPNGMIRLPINEALDDVSTVAEFLNMANGAGYQHIAFQSNNIYAAVESMLKNGISFMSMPDTYYELIDKRFPNHNESLEDLKRLQISIDGVNEVSDKENRTLLQIFTKMLIKPIFYEVIQRKNYDGFGEGNTEALSQALELDQFRRGVLK